MAKSVAVGGGIVTPSGGMLFPAMLSLVLAEFGNR